MLKKRFFLFFLAFSFSLLGGDFKRVHKGSPEYAFVEKTFQSVLVPLYGDQSKSLSKIADETDRICELFCEEDLPLGLLVYKTNLVHDYVLLGIQDAFEIKTLFVVEALKNSGKGIGSQLLQRVLGVAKNIFAKNVVVTVSEAKPEAVRFFLKNGFNAVHTFHGKYTPGVDEYLFAKPLVG